MYTRSAELRFCCGLFATTMPSMRVLAVQPHSAAISRSQCQNCGSSRNDVWWPWMHTRLGLIRPGIRNLTRRGDGSRATASVTYLFVWRSDLSVGVRERGSLAQRSTCRHVLSGYRVR